MFHRTPLDGAELEYLQLQISTMTFPVLCQCGKVYDMAKVSVTQRYLDATFWDTPCCRQKADDRGPGWTQGPSYEYLS